MTNEQLANSFRVLARKEQVDYSKKEYAQSNIAVIRKLLGVAEEGISESGTSSGCGYR